MRVFYAVCAQQEKDEPEIKSVVISQKECVMGRGDVAIAVSDDRCSRRHAQLLSFGVGIVKIKDLGSRNGTYVNGKRVSEAPLLPGTHVRIGRTQIKIVRIVDEEKTPSLRPASDLATPAGGPSHSDPVSDLREVNEVASMKVSHQGWSKFFECLPTHLKEQFAAYRAQTESQRLR